MADKIKTEKNTAVNIDEKKLSELRAIISEYTDISGRRLSHTLSVEKECGVLAEIFGLCGNDRRRLCAAALLHDITKEKTLDEQLALCRHYDIDYPHETERSPKVFHGWTASAVMRDKYAEYCDEEMCSAVFVHTTGREDMTLFESLLYLADYIEPLRKYESCLAVRDYFYNGVAEIACPESDRENNLIILLFRTLLKSFDCTIKELIREQEEIFYLTVKSRNSLIHKLTVHNLS